MIKNKPTLVILAAGVGSRYGGLKQLDTFTNHGATIMDFSVHDALQAGFGKFVFVIRKNIETELRSVFDEKLKGKAEVAYVFQELDCVPKAFQNPQRTKPWGTGHALLMAKDKVTENFAVINADDFYGKEAFEVMASQLIQTDKNSYEFSSMAYFLKNTVSDHGYVSRGECRLDSNGFLIDVTERTHIEKVADGLVRKDDFGNFVPIAEDTIVSMNFWGFTPKCFEFGQALFDQFLEDNTDNLKAEFYIPTVVNEILNSGIASVKVLKSNAQWFGVTYQEDKEIVKAAIQNLQSQGVYPTKLW
ncbi:MAG: sugar phosphate nucleotidyltransferase [Flavobacteriaceae bacterium]|nr:sugar phosphate nucleotidyltransferase [Flavobacteriaceae bacterium]MDG2314087.1 sugar phosphate nucleotidyltransferase [Flavobacteriaceae bacterium]